MVPPLPGSGTLASRLSKSEAHVIAPELFVLFNMLLFEP